MGKRGLSELSVVATGVQKLEDRFGKRRQHDYEDLPPISQWRCNLTAMSQEHNLYFVAYGQDIHVFMPRYPVQEVSEKPVLIVSSQPSSPGLQGYLDPRCPHTINTLIVQHLGNDEVIATVRDDGDVDAVLVRHIVQAIERRTEPDSTIGCLADEVKPIFQDNVGISAWGLAIHSQGRVIAVSSNAHEVRIFKFALLEDELEEHDPDLSRLPDATEDSADHRRMDVTQRVLNGDANIPCIAFCNTGDDPDARWLLATDLTGYSRVMDLHSTDDMGLIVQQFRFGRTFVSHHGGFDRLNAGWAIMFLDLRSFQREDDFHSAVGLPEGDVLPGNKSNSHMWDLSDTVDHVADRSHAFLHHGVKNKRKHRRPQSEGSQPGQERNSPLASPRIEHVETHADQFPPEDPMDDVESPDGGVALEGEMEVTLDDGNGEMDDDDMEMDDSEESELEGPDMQQDDLSFLIDDDEDHENEGTEDSISYNTYYGGKRIFANQPYFFDKSTGLCQDLPCPILHASVKNVYLLQPTNEYYSKSAFVAPMVGMANPLRQAVCNQFGYLNMFDRLNMTAYIPSIGVVVLASQKGRALVLALTKLPPGAARSAADLPTSQATLHKTNYAMRVESILPFASQEQENQRPFAPLHGIAAGPMQGTEDAPDNHKRWRLLMMYQDHSILSYEIRRPRVGHSEVDVEPVIV